MSKTIKLYNKGSREIQFAGGILAAGKSAEVPEKEANNLLSLFVGEVCEASEIVEGSVSVKSLLAEIAELKARIAELEGAEEAVEPKKRGRKPKAEEAVEPQEGDVLPE